MSSAASTVVVLSTSPPDTLPAAAAGALRAADECYIAGDVAESVCAELGGKSVTDPEPFRRGEHPGTVVLVSTSLAHPCAAALVEAGARVIEPTPQPLLQAVSIMDQLRAPNGCPWDAAQTHDSLRQYLVEEAYELLDAVESGDRVALREELGDVLLQVLFHARIAAEHPDDPFGITDVARALVDKLVGRHPAVFGDGETVQTPEHQQRRWEELKQTEKRRDSVVDGVALGQPAAALAGKLGQRTARVGVPFDLLPDGSGTGEKLFRLAAVARRSGIDPEGELRTVAKGFFSALRGAERAARAAGVDPATLDADGWRRYWRHCAE